MQVGSSFQNSVWNTSGKRLSPILLPCSCCYIARSGVLWNVDKTASIGHQLINVRFKSPDPAALMKSSVQVDDEQQSYFSQIHLIQRMHNITTNNNKRRFTRGKGFLNLRSSGGGRKSPTLGCYNNRIKMQVERSDTWPMLPMFDVLL